MNDECFSASQQSDELGSIIILLYKWEKYTYEVKWHVPGSSVIT